MDEPSDTATVQPAGWRRALLRWTACFALLFLFKGCVLDQYTIPSDSMRPTLQGEGRFFSDDRVLVNKWVYGPRIPLTTIRLWPWSAPKRWDIVVFHSVDPKEAHPVLIKRVAGLPGERVHIKGGKLLINGEAVEPPSDLKPWLHYISTERPTKSEAYRQFLQWAKDSPDLPLLNPENPRASQLLADLKAWHEKLRGVYVGTLTDAELEQWCQGVAPVSIDIAREVIIDYMRPMLRYGVREEDEFSVVPPGNYFLLGDNTAVSGDGRIWGWVPHDHLFGPAIAIWWPWAHRRDFTGFSHTWWGMGLVYGLPLALVAADLIEMLRKRRAKKRATESA